MAITATNVLRTPNKSVTKVVTTAIAQVSEAYDLTGVRSLFIAGTGANAIEAWLPNVSDAGVISVPAHGSEEDPNYEITAIVVGSGVSGDIVEGSNTYPLFIPEHAMPPHCYFKFAVAGTYYITINYA